MKSIVHIDQHVIKRNAKEKTLDPPITVKTYKSNSKHYIVGICDSEGNVVAKIIYRPDKPLSCGARVWLETENEVKVIKHGA